MNIRPRRLRSGKLVVQAKPWFSILGRYDKLSASNKVFLPMRDFVERVVEALQSNDLYGDTSMHDLLISNVPVFCVGENELRVVYKFEAAQFSFRYSQYANDTNCMTKQVPVAEAWDTFTRFVRYKFGVLIP